MPDTERPRNHHCQPSAGVIEGAVFYSSKTRSWVMTVVPTAGPPRQQRMDVRFCPWCGKDLESLVPDENASLIE